MAKASKTQACPDCKGTGVYIGFWLDVGPCLTCKGRRAPGSHGVPPTVQFGCKGQESVQLNVNLKDAWNKLFGSPKPALRP